MRTYWSIMSVLFALGCVGIVTTACPQLPLVVPITPPTPVPVVVDPVTPTPPEPTPGPANVIKHAVVVQVIPGMNNSSLQAMLGPPSLGPVRQDDGTALTRWPAENAEGAPRWLDVQQDAAGVVLGRALWPR